MSGQCSRLIAQGLFQFLTHKQVLIVRLPIPDILLGSGKRQAAAACFLEQAPGQQASAGGTLGKAKTHENENDYQAKEKSR